MWSTRLLYLLIIFSLQSIGSLHAQMSVKDSVFSFSLCSVTGGFSEPGGDLADRFGSNFSIGANYFRKLRSNWMIGLQGDFLFGENVNEDDFLDAFTTSQGEIISQAGTYGSILLYERGWRTEVRAGRIFPVIGPNDNSGIVLMAGAGFIQHKIRIETQGDNIPFLEGDYLKGYDRLTNGFCYSGFLGYYNFGNKRRVNFFLGVEATLANTRSRRDFDFDTRQKDTRLRSDRLFGIRAGWIIPLYKKVPNAYYYD
ncbi:MAG: hypothetical protein RL213_1835 [Bacteroidota bacterium]|jgi:hypothetical protein